MLLDRRVSRWCGSVILASTLWTWCSFASASEVAPWVGESLAGAPCLGGQGTRPRDYTNRAANIEQLQLNERFHFTKSVENLTGGQSGSIPADIDFMLRAWPNHHRALNSLSRYQLQLTRGQRKPLTPVECYFQRAINFSPNDSNSVLLYAIFLHKSKYLEKALEQYRRAEAISPTDAQIQYNLALLLVEMEEYEEARAYAKKLYVNGFPLPGLRRKLNKAGYWGDKEDMSND